MRGSAAATQKRNAKGQFVKNTTAPKPEKLELKDFSGGFSDVNGWGFPEETPRRRYPWARFKRFVSHYRVEILGYVLYLVLIAIVSGVSAYFGARYGLQ